MDLEQFYRVLDTWDRSGGGGRMATPRAAVARRWLWETDDAVRMALNHLVEELYDRREDVQSMLQRLDRNGTGTISRQVGHCTLRDVERCGRDCRE